MTEYSRLFFPSLERSIVVKGVEMEDLSKSFKAPFNYTDGGGYVFDADNNMVLEIRGWGRRSSQNRKKKEKEKSE